MKKVVLFFVLALLVLTGLSAVTAGAPDWVYNDVSTSEKYCVSAYAKMSKKQNSIRRAQTEAKNLLAEHINTVVSEIVQTCTSEFISDDEVKTADSFLSVSKQYAQATIKGAKQEAMWEDPDGGIWVLMSIPTSEVEKTLDTAVDDVWKTTGSNSSFEIANRMMHEAIERYFNPDDSLSPASGNKEGGI